MHNEAHIWFGFPGDIGNDEVASKYLLLLDPGERAQHDRLRFAPDRYAYLASHVMLRLCLSRYAPLSPSEWSFERDGYGRPEIAGKGAGFSLRFSLSHGRDMVACAITTACPCGVDVERIARVTDPLSIARRFFGGGEIEQLEALEAASRDLRFAELWTLKEAALKVTGQGLAASLRSIVFDVEDGGAVCGEWRTGEYGPPEEWAYHLMNPTADHVLAATVRTADAESVVFRLRRFHL